MTRPYTSGDYICIANKLRDAVPDIAISTDIMVGFPGEREANFQNTMTFIKEIKPMRLHAFGFSKRIGTPAHDYRDDVPSAIKKEREHALMDIVKGFTKEFEGIFIGKIARVLIEDKRDKDGFLQGYTDRYIKVSIDGPSSVKSCLLTCQLTLLPAKNTYQKEGAGLTNQKVYGILLSYSD
jgi:threonylcarbamoyladenosine tRNA methylthiotransferase MtaB